MFLCLSDIKPGKDIKSTCEHVFHKKCLITWTLDYNKHSCPICRDVIRVPKNKYRCHTCFHPNRLIHYLKTYNYNIGED